MTYLELVNGVLSRMREDTVTTVSGSDDVVVNIVKDLVNDAKETVENAHNWSMLETSWTVNTSADTAAYGLTNSGKYAIIETIVDDKGTEVPLTTKAYVRSNPLPNNSKPFYYLPSGLDNNSDLKITLYPTPDDAYAFTVYGYAKQAALSSDSDALLVPDRPVLYLALALALRERGEVGGQTAAEVFMMAEGYLSDAIALDASLSGLDDIWYST